MTENIIGMTAIIGFVNMVNMLIEGNFKSFIKAFIGVFLGVVFGFFGYFGINGIEMGLLVGLSASGLFKLSQNIGNIKIKQK